MGFLPNMIILAAPHEVAENMHKSMLVSTNCNHVNTSEEYAEKRSEGARSMFGHLTLNACIQAADLQPWD